MMQELDDELDTIKTIAEVEYDEGRELANTNTNESRMIEPVALDISKMPTELRHKYSMKLPLIEFMDVAAKYPDEFTDLDIRFKKCAGNWKIAVVNNDPEVFDIFADDGCTDINTDLVLYLTLSLKCIDFFKRQLESTIVTDPMSIIRLLTAAGLNSEEMVTYVITRCAIELNGFMANLIQNWVRRSWHSPILTLKKMLPVSEFSKLGSAMLIQTCAQFGQLETLKLVTNDGLLLTTMTEEPIMNIMRNAVEGKNYELYCFIIAHLPDDPSHILLERICTDATQF